MVQLLPLCSIARWSIFNLFLFTNWFSGSQQFLIMNTTFFMLDLYFTLYAPCTWVKESIEKNWAGWGKNIKKGTHFYFVRKPDPREELLRKGYFKKVGCFAYIRKKTNLIKDMPQLPSDNNSIFEIRKLRRHVASTSTISKSSEQEWYSLPAVEI